MEYLEFTGKSVDEALTNAAIAMGVPSDELDYTVIEEASSGFLGLFNTKPAKIKVSKKASVEDVVNKFLGDMFDAMNMSVKIEVNVNEEEETVNINLTGEDMGLLIGKRGQTLDSLQYLVRLVVNKEFGGYLKVKVDTENYRERRKETLESLAKNIAYKVKRTRRSVTLEPMNPYERRIIHSTLQNDKFVATRSEGEEPYRHVVVYLKKHTNNN
ncbi:MAG: protein jag [Thermoflexaceae bacterium]|nr:protein jag [Thermoflexaceae bacterium]